jgi:glycosyltransferase involved in cell wall biosynthesis
MPPTQRVLLFSTLYPNAIRPGHGIFVETRLRQLLDDGGVEARVLAPVPWFPLAGARFGAYGDYARVPRHEMRHGIEVRHPRYLVVPKVGMSLAPFTLAAAGLAAARRLLAAGHQFDLIDAHYLYPDGVAAALIGRALGKPVVMTARGSDVNVLPRHAVPRRLIGWAARNTAAIVTVAAALKDALVALGVDARRVVVLRNGVDLELFRPRDRAQARAAFGADGYCVACVANLVPLKGVDLVLRAIAATPDATLLIAGSGPEEGTLRALAHALGIAPRVRFLGRLEQRHLPDLYSAADALVLASRSEGSANVLLEAMACGTPVVASAVGGGPEIVSAPAAGLLLDERTPEALARALAALRARPPERGATRRHAEGFDWQSTSRGQRRVFAAALAGRAPEV